MSTRDLSEVDFSGFAFIGSGKGNVGALELGQLASELFVKKYKELLSVLPDRGTP